jgi:hypothetical protein
LISQLIKAKEAVSSQTIPLSKSTREINVIKPLKIMKKKKVSKLKPPTNPSQQTFSISDSVGVNIRINQFNSSAALTPSSKSSGIF